MLSFFVREAKENDGLSTAEAVDDVLDMFEVTSLVAVAVSLIYVIGNKL